MKRLLRTLSAVALLGGALLSSQQSNALTLRQELYNGLLVLHFDGKIEHGDFDKVFDFYRQIGKTYTGSKMVVSLDSPGGYVIEASRIAVFLRELNQSTAVTPTHRCLSACFLLFAAGQQRFASRGAVIGVHRAGEYGDYGTTGDVVARDLTEKMSQKLAEYGVSSQIINKLNATNFTTISLLNDADLRSMNVTMIDIATASVAPAPAPHPAVSRQQPRKPRVREDVGANSPYGFTRN